MRRPAEHVKEDISIQILKRKIPAKWILRDYNPDYGIDKSLEIVEDGVVTGKEILIQLKGTEKLGIHGNDISFSIKANHLKYYLERDIPVFLIVVDLKKEKCYWVFLQQFAFDILNIKNPTWENQQTVTIKIPYENEVSNTIDAIVEIAYGGSAYILSRKINQIPSKHLAKWKTNTEAIIQKSKVAENFLEKSLELKLEVSYHYDKGGEDQKSIETLKKIYESALGASNKNYALKAGLLIAYQLNPFDQNETVWHWLNKLEPLVKEVDNNSYNILWWGSIIETVYIKLIKEYNSLLRLALVSSQKPSIMTPFLAKEIQEKISQLLKSEKDFVYYLNKAYEDKEYLLYLDFLRRLAKMHWMWIYNNSLKGNPLIILNQLKSIEKMLSFAKDLSEVIDEDQKFMILLDLAYLYNSAENIPLRDSAIKEAKELAEKLEHKGYLKGIERAKEVFERLPTIPYLLQFDKSGLRQEKPTLEQEEEMIKTLLSDAGIDIEKGTDELAELARIGLKDRNPERILKHCEKLYVDIVTYGPIWDMVGLPETGLKILYCEKKGSIMGHSLDELLEMFKKDNCKDCEYHSPRPCEWKWTREWHKNRKKLEGMKKTIKNFFEH